MLLKANLYSKIGYRVSCTVSINNKAVCVHDNVWKRCKVSPELSIAGVDAGFPRNRKDTRSKILFARLRLHGRN